MVDMMYFNGDSLLGVANKLDRSAQTLECVVSRLRSIHITAESGADVKISGVKLSSLIRQSSTNITKTADKFQTLSGSVRSAVSLFETTESELTKALGGEVTEEPYVVTAGTGTASSAQCPANPEVYGNTADKTASDKAARETKAKWVKIGVTALAIVGTIALTAVTGGGALVVIGGAAVTGGITGITYSAADQYAEKGWDGIDWGEAAWQGAIGTAVGAATGGVGYYTGGAVTQGVQQTIARHFGASAANGIVGNAIAGTTSQVVSGMASRGTGEVTRTILLGEELDGQVLWDSVFDTEAMAKDAVTGGGMGAYKGYQSTKAAEAARTNPQYDQRIGSEYRDADGTPSYQKMGLDGDNCAVDGKWENTNLAKGTKIDRYGSENGHFTSPAGTSFDQRGLPTVENDGIYHQYEVVNPNGIDVRTSKIKSIPGLDNGGGTQYESALSIDKLIRNGDIVELYHNNNVTDGVYTMKKHANQ